MFHSFLSHPPGPVGLTEVSITILSIHVESDKGPYIEYFRDLLTELGRPIPDVKTCSRGFQILSRVSWLEEICLSW